MYSVRERYSICQLNGRFCAAGMKRGAIMSIADLFDVDPGSVRNVITRYIETGSLDAPGHVAGGRPARLSRADLLVLEKVVLRVLEERASKGLFSSCKILHDCARSSEHIANTPLVAILSSFSERRFLDTLHSLGLVWSDRVSKHSASSVLRLKHCAMRDQFLDDYFRNLELPQDEQYIMVYQDESYVHVHHHATMSWVMSPAASRLSAASATPTSPTTAALRPSRCEPAASSAETHAARSVRHKGERICFSAAITEDGLLPGSFWYFCPNRPSSKGYHSSFNSENFNQYVFGMLPGLPNTSLVPAFEAAYPGRKALFILDNASYHKNHLDLSLPKGGAARREYHAYAVDHGIPVEAVWTIVRMKEAIRQWRDLQGTTIERYLRSRGHRVLYTPPHYSWWQPIELYCAAVKNDIAKKYKTTRTIPELTQQLENAIQLHGTKEVVFKLVAHCTNLMRNAREAAANAAAPLSSSSDEDEKFSSDDDGDDE